LQSGSLLKQDCILKKALAAIPRWPSSEMGPPNLRNNPLQNDYYTQLIALRTIEEMDWLQPASSQVARAPSRWR